MLSHYFLSGKQTIQKAEEAIGSSLSNLKSLKTMQRQDREMVREEDQVCLEYFTKFVIF